MNYKEILLDLGYSNIIEGPKEYRARPIYRDSDNGTVLSVKKDTGHFIDFARNISGSFEDLIKLSLNLKDSKEAKEWLNSKNSYILSKGEIKKPEIKMAKVFNKEILAKLAPDHSYWINRGVSEDSVKDFKGGIIREGKMKDRYVFPIFNHKQELIGVSGRDLLTSQASMRPKWKHIGDKSEWKYPLFLNHQVIKDQKKAILVESIGDMLSLWDSGIKNVVVTFGLDVSVSIINFLLRYDIDKIHISFNNDQEGNSAGNMAAEKAKKKLLKYFDFGQVLVSLPIKKDFGEMAKEEILEWKNNLK